MFIQKSFTVSNRVSFHPLLNSVFRIEYNPITGRSFHQKNSIPNPFVDAQSGELKNSIQVNIFMSGVYDDSKAKEIFGVKDEFGHLWVGIQESRKTTYLNSFFRPELKYEDCIETIEGEINKKKSKWTLSALQWLSWDDIGQILRIHIHKKFSLWNQNRPLAPYLSVLITHQLSNLIRNLYGNYVSPCHECPAREENGLCSVYGTQGTSCQLYKKWIETKKQAYDTKLPLSLEFHTNEVQNKECQSIDLEKAAERLHNRMKEILDKDQWIVYKYLYIDGKDEENLGKMLGYKSNEKGRQAGYRTLKYIKDYIMKRAEEELNNDEVDIF